MTRQEINKIHSLLWRKGFKQIIYFPKHQNWKEEKIEVHSNAIMVNPNLEEIKKLIGEKYSVTGDTNLETITIK